MVIHMFNDLYNLRDTLRIEGFDATYQVFRGIEGLDVVYEGMEPEESATGWSTARTSAEFFPWWELNQNLGLLDRRDFAAIKAKRPRNWSPVPFENKSQETQKLVHLRRSSAVNRG
jgi:hypothetical protein